MSRASHQLSSARGGAVGLASASSVSGAARGGRSRGLRKAALSSASGVVAGSSAHARRLCPSHPAACSADSSSRCSSSGPSIAAPRPWHCTTTAAWWAPTSWRSHACRSLPKARHSRAAIPMCKKVRTKATTAAAASLGEPSGTCSMESVPKPDGASGAAEAKRGSRSGRATSPDTSRNLIMNDAYRISIAASKPARICITSRSIAVSLPLSGLQNALFHQ